MEHGAEWTLKEFFVLPNEFIYWSIQIVTYQLMTGLVVGAFVLSSLYYLFENKSLKDMSRFSLIFSFVLLCVAPIPLMLHLQQPQRGPQVFFTPHLTSAMAAFGFVFFVCASIIATQIWFVYRKYFVEQSIALKNADKFLDKAKGMLYTILTLGAYDIREELLQKDAKVIRCLSGLGVPVAMFLHGYAGFIFGSVKANALWMTPLMPVIFIMSATVSGVALSMLTYIVVMEIRRFQVLRAKKVGEHLTPDEVKGAEIDNIRKTTKYLIGFIIGAIVLEVFDLVFRGYTALKTWNILRPVIYEKEFFNIFVLQYTLGNLLPLILIWLPKLSIRRTVFCLLLVMFGIFMMRWNVVIGGQSFSSTFEGFMHYNIPFIPHDLDTYKEGVLGVITVLVLPFIGFWIVNKIVPALKDN